MIKLNPFNILRKPQKLASESSNAPEYLSAPIFRTQSNLKLLNPLPVKLKTDTATVQVGNAMDSYSQFATYVNKKKYTEMGRHTFDIENNILDGIEMDTWDKFQGNGIGEIMRLVSVIETAENNLKGISAISLSRAVPFHFKYFFRPDFSNSINSAAISQQGNIEKILTQIANNEHSESCTKEKAQILNKFMQNSGLNPEFVQKFDEFLTGYIKENLHRWDKTGFFPENKLTVPMSLKSETIRQNAGFFNELFKKHGIDYTI